MRFCVVADDLIPDRLRLKHLRISRKVIVAVTAGDQDDVHPLPLLTCQKTGSGGGDFVGECAPGLGTWADDVLSMEGRKTAGYRKVKFVARWGDG